MEIREQQRQSSSPSMVLLDRATSNVDTCTEQKIQEALKVKS